ncbi:MAG TPA: M48 family metallopeptidase [Mycobacteriales bacterium]|nr:M48 family metallopeptidase [Mycobacteriales bacterium]
MRGPWLTLLVCVAAAVAVVALTVPFPVLAGAHPQVDVARDFSASEVAREQAFHAAVRPWAYASLTVGLLLAGLLGLTRWGARLVGGVPGHWTVKAVAGTALLLALGQLLTLPFDARAEVGLRRYGLSTQTWASWTDDRLRGLAVQVVLTGIAVLVVLALVRRLPGSWWAAGAAAAVLLTVGGSYVYPVVVEPVFNRFTPMADGPLRTELLALAERDHVRVKDVLVADASRRTTALNAYVSGFGSSRRIVVYDTLVREASPREVELVVAHELGHAKRQDVLVGTVIAALLAAAGVCGLFLLLSSGRVLARVGASGPDDPRVLPLVLFLAVLVPLLAAPVTNLVSRHVEARADLHSLELTGDVPTFISTEQRLARTNLSSLDPHPLVYAFFFTHPTTPQRIALARAWEQRR